MVYYCRAHDLPWDPRQDILFLCQYYGQEIRSVQSQLDQKALQQDFLATPFIRRLPFQDLQNCYQILLGTEPPPTMALTPPTQPLGHKYSASASDATGKPRTSSQRSPDFLSPPTQKKLKTAQELPLNESHKPSGSLAPQKAPVRVIPELAASERDSRTRYRPVSSPNSQKVSQTGPQPTTTNATDVSHLPRLPAISIPQSGTSHNLPLPSHLAPAPVITTSRRSMPNLHAGPKGPIPPYAFTQTPFVQGATQLHQQQYQYMSRVELSATPVPLNPGQHHLKSQLGLAGSSTHSNYLPNNMPITGRPLPPQARASYQAPPLIRAELSGTPTINTQSTKQHLMSTDGNSGGLMDQSLDGKDSKTHLQLIGSESVYRAQEELHSVTQSAPNAINPAPIKHHSVADGLDAITQLGQFISELSAERNTPAPEHHTTQQSQHATPIQYRESPYPATGPGHITTSALENSPASTADNIVPQDATVTAYQDLPIRPLNIRAHSVPPTALPASLMAGGSTSHHPHQRTPSNDTNQPPATTSESAQAMPPNTNASRYTRYYAAYSTPSSTANSTAGSPQPTPASTYKAYHPPPTPLSSPSLPLDSSAERASRPPTYATMRDVDGTQGFFRHKRDASHDSQASSASHDSGKLAQEYQAELPTFEEGYGASERA
jgi:hypothetical protein